MILIDREAIPFKIRKFYRNGELHYKMVAEIDEVERLPVFDVDPKRFCMMARVHDREFMCMACGARFVSTSEIEKIHFRFCPMCGAEVSSEVV